MTDNLSPTQSEIEWVARAIFMSHNETYSFGGLLQWQNDPEHWCRYARAAIAAMNTASPKKGLKIIPADPVKLEDDEGIYSASDNGRLRGMATELFGLLDEMDNFNRSGSTRHGVGELRLRVDNALDRYRTALNSQGEG